jgi:abortive infection bacteriophage resistance protein
MDLLERIEVSLRTEVSLQMGRYDPWAHTRPPWASLEQATRK